MWNKILGKKKPHQKSRSDSALDEDSRVLRNTIQPIRSISHPFRAGNRSIEENVSVSTLMTERGGIQTRPSVRSITPPADNNPETDREIASAAHRLGGNIQKIVLAARMGTQTKLRRNVSKTEGDAWKLRLLQVLGGVQHVEDNDTESNTAKTPKSDVDILLYNANCENFVLRCMENELPPNLLHCLRLLRVLELQLAHSHLSNQSLSDDSSNAVEPLSKLATSKVERLLTLLCTDETVGEQLRPHLFGLLALSGSGYPSNGKHIAYTASNVIIQIARDCLSNSLVWFLHDKQMIMRMTDDVRELCGMAEAPSPTSAAVCLHGKEAETAGLWVSSLNAIVQLVKFSCNHQCDVLLTDFQNSGGYHLLLYAISNSTPGNVKELIQATIILLSCKSGAFVNKDENEEDDYADIDDLMKPFEVTLGKNNPGNEDGLVKNPIAFEVIENVLHRSVPFLIYYYDQYKEKPIIEIGDKTRELAAFSLEISGKMIRDGGECDAISHETLHPFDIATQILISTLQIFSDHPKNFSIMEKKYNVLSLYLLSFSTFRDDEFKTLILKMLEFVCTGLSDSNCDKPLHMASEIFFCLCKTLLRLSIDGEEKNGKVIEALKVDALLICDTLEKLLEVNYSLTQVMVDVGVMEEKIDEFFSLIMAARPDLLNIENEEFDLQQDSYDPPSSTSIDYVYSAFCRIIDFVVKGYVAASAVSSPSRARTSYKYGARSHNLPRNHDLNLLLAAGINELGNGSSTASLKVFESKISSYSDDALQTDMECVLHILDCFSVKFDRIAGVSSSKPSAKEEDAVTAKLVKRNSNSILRVEKLLTMLKVVLKRNRWAQDAFRKDGGYESLVRLLLCLGGIFPSVTENIDEKSTDTEAMQSILLVVQETFGVLDASTAPVQGKGKNVSTMSTSIKAMDMLSEDCMHSLSPDSANRAYIQDNGVFTAVVEAVASIGLLVSQQNARFVMNLALGLLHPNLFISEKNTEDSKDNFPVCNVTEINTLSNPDASRLVLDVVVQLSRMNSFMSLAEQATDQLLELCAFRRAGTTLAQLADSGLCQSLTGSNGFAFIYDDLDHPLFPRFVELLRSISTLKMSCMDFVGMLRCIAGPLLLTRNEEEGSYWNRKNRRIRLPVIGSSMGTSFNGVQGEIVKSDQWMEREKNLCTRLETLCTIAEQGDKVARCIVGGDSLNNIALFMPDIPIDEKLYSLAEKGRIKFIEVEKVYDTPESVTSMHNSVGSGPISSTEKLWAPAHASGFSYSIWLRLLDSAESNSGNGNVFILDLSAPPGQFKNSRLVEEQRDFLSVWYDYQSQGFNVIASISPKTVCFPISPLSPNVWHHVLLTFQPPKRAVLSRKSVIGLCVDGRALEADIKIDPVSFPPNSRLYIGAPNPFLASSGIVRGTLPVWELGSTLLLSTILGPRDAMSIFAAGPDFHGQFWGDRPQRLSLTSTATTTFSMLAANGEAGSLTEALKRRNMSVVETAGYLDNSYDRDLDPDSLRYVGLFCNVMPGHIISAFRASSSTTSMRDGSASSNRSHYSRRLVNVARINSSNGLLSTDAVVYGSGSIISPCCFAHNLQWVGGPIVLLPIVNAAQSPEMLALALRLIRESVYRHIPNLEMLQAGGGYRIIGLLLRQKGMMNGSILEQCFAFAVDGFLPGTAEEPDNDDKTSSSFRRTIMPFSWLSSYQWVLVDLDAMQYLLLNHQVWEIQAGGPNLTIRLLSFLNGLVGPNTVHAAFNSKRLHTLGIVKWTLHLMLEITEIYASGNVGSEISGRSDDNNDNQGDDILSGVQTSFKNGWYSKTSSVASTSVGGDPGNPLLLCCKTFLRRILAYMLTPDDLETISGAAMYTTSIDGMQYDIRCQLGLEKNDERLEELDEDDNLFMGSVARVYLLRLLEELVVDGVNDIVTTVVNKDVSETVGTLDSLPHAGGGSIANQSYLSVAVRRKRTGFTSSDEENSRKERQAQAFLSAFAAIFKPVWFACILQGCRDEASAAAVFRLLILMHQSTPSFSVSFEEAGGFSPFVLSIPKFSTSPSITLSMLSQLLHAPILHLPCFGSLDPIQLCTVFDLESDATELIVNDNVHSSVNTPSDPSCGIFALLAECLGRNIQLSAVENEVGAKARQTNEAVIALLCQRHTVSSAFQNFCRTPDFLEPLAQSLCLLLTRKKQSHHSQDTSLRENQTDKIRHREKSLQEELHDEDLSLSETTSAVSGSEVHSNNNLTCDIEGDVDEVYVPWPAEIVSSETDEIHKMKVCVTAGSQTERLVGKVNEGGSNAIGLVQLLYHVLSHAVLSRPYAAPLVNALFRSFPIHALYEQVAVFHMVLIEQFGSIANDAMQCGEPIALANCVGVSSILLDRLMAGFFGAEAASEVVKIIMSTLNHVSTPETYASKTLSKIDLRTFLIADAAHIARLTCLAALQQVQPSSECNSRDEHLHREVLTAINMSLKQLLFTSSTKRNTQIMKPTQALPALAWRSASIERCDTSSSCRYPSISEVNGPDRAFIMAIMAEVRLILLAEDQKTREEAVLLIISLLQERYGIMSDILIKEIAIDTDLVQSVDLLNEGGFGDLLMEENIRDSSDSHEIQIELCPIDQGQFIEFFKWLEENHSDLEVVFSGIHKEVARLIPGIYGARASSPREAAEREQKEMLVKLASQETSDRTILGNIERSQLYSASLIKTSESQAMWKRQGFDYLASGAMQWKFLLLQLKGSRSIWEGRFYLEDPPFSFKTLVTTWRQNRVGIADKDFFESKPLAQDSENISPPFELVTRWKLDVTEAYEKQRRRLLPNYEFHSLYNIDETIDTDEYKEIKNCNYKDINTCDEDNSDLVESNPCSGSMVATATLLKSMHLGASTKLDEEDYDPDDSTYDMSTEADSYWDNLSEDIDDIVVRNDMSLNVGKSEQDSSAEQVVTNRMSELGQLKVGNSSNVLVIENQDTNSDADFYENSKPDEHQSIRRDDILASNYDVIIGLLHNRDFPEKSYNVKRCIGLEVCQALLLLCRNAIYVIDGFEQRDEDGLKGEIIRLEKSTSTFNVNLRKDKSLESGDQPDRTSSRMGSYQNKKKGKPEQDSSDEISYQQHKCKRLALSDVYVVYRRRYQLQQNALEFYDVQKNGTLIAFADEGKREEVLSIVLSRPLPNSIFNSTAALALGAATAINYDKFMNTLRARITNQWVQGKMTNFDFIMHMNIFAGRSYNDLTQYPVFPWVIADYESDEIDLKNPCVYRDLSKPMGALGVARAAQFKERYEALQSNCVDEYDPPPFHYGTHYSCAAYVLNYLLRLEPFSRLALSLQGGRFDLPDRLFHNIGANWRSASKDNLQDVRELIPEFFFLPEFLVNSNGFDFGVTQHGKTVHHVTLPPWANGDPRRFVRINRQALESDYVSRDLHLWLDLIFGYKQRGREAVAALNTFVHVTYEGAVDIDTIKDPVQRKSTIAQIQNFGQIPSRLERKPFPARNVVTTLKDGTFDFGALAHLEPLTPPFCIVGAPHKVLLRVISQGICATVGMAGQADSAVGDMCLNKGQPLGVGKTCALIIPTKRYIRFGGSNNGVSVHVAFTASRAKEINAVVTIHDNMHRAPITALKPSRNGQWLVSGCMDSTVRVWKYDSGHMELKATLCGHDGAKVTCIDVCVIFGTIVTGDTVGNVLVWDLRTLQYLRQLRQTNCKKLDAKYCSPDHVVSVSLNHKTGDILTLVGVSLTIFDINGNLVAKQPEETLLSSDDNMVPSCAISTDCPEWMEDGIVAVTGHKNGDIRLWVVNRDEEFLEMKHLLSDKVHSCPITCLRIEGRRHDKLLLAGDKSGKMSVAETIKLEMLSQKDLTNLADSL